MVRKLLLTSSLFAFAQAVQAAPPPVRESVAICDPGQNQITTPLSCATVINGILQTSSGGGGGGGTVSGSQSNASGGTTGSTNLGTNSYNYVWNGSAWGQWLADTSYRPYVDPVGSAGAVFDQGVGASTTYTLRATLGSGTQTIGSIANTSFGISGTLPAYAATPTFNCGTGCYQATQPISAASLPLPSNAAQETGGNLATIATNTANHAVTNAGTFAVQNTAATPAGSNSIGNVGLNAGSNIVGKVDIDQTTPGTTNGVTVAPTASAPGATTFGGIGNAGFVVKSSAGNVYGLSVCAASTAGYAILLNQTTVASGAMGNYMRVYYLAANQCVDISWDIPKVFSTGISFAFSSSYTTYTAVTPASAFIDYK